MKTKQISAEFKHCNADSLSLDSSDGKLIGDNIFALRS